LGQRDKEEEGGRKDQGRREAEREGGRKARHMGVFASRIPKI